MLNKKRIIYFTLIIITVISLNSCITTPVCLTPSNTPLVNREVEANLGPVSGSSGVWSFNGFSILGLWMFGRPDIESAVQNAIAEKEGDALINVRCYETFRYFILFSLSSVTVEGEAVRFKK